MRVNRKKNKMYAPVFLKRFMRWLGFTYQKETEEEKIKRNVKKAIDLCQESRFITRKDLEKVRERNVKHDFTKSR